MKRQGQLFHLEILLDIDTICNSEVAHVSSWLYESFSGTRFCYRKLKSVLSRGADRVQLFSRKRSGPLFYLYAAYVLREHILIIDIY